MTKLERLRREALKAAIFRGHTMRRFRYHEHAGRTIGQSDCLLCGKWAKVDTKPMPNGIDISGEAVATHCRPTIKHIAEQNAKAGRHYFAADTLRFFGQTMRSLRVRKVAGRVFVQGSSYWDSEYMGESFVEFDPKTGKTASVRDVDRTKRAVAEFLGSLA